jgi:hypothetical protein
MIEFILSLKKYNENLSHTDQTTLFIPYLERSQQIFDL